MNFWSRKGSTKQGDGTVNSGNLPPSIIGRSSVPFVGETLKFHDEAHDTVVRAVSCTHSSIVRLNILAKDVALLTAYEDCKRVLDQRWETDEQIGCDTHLSVSRGQAYAQLMSAFYSPPNLLLEDENGEGARQHRTAWNTMISQSLQTSSLMRRASEQVDEWAEHIVQQQQSGQHLDLYEICKDLGHRLALYTFLGLKPSHQHSSQYDQAKEWSEQMLRGQFSLPFSVNTGFFQNAFSRGQAAKRKFDDAVQHNIRHTQQSIPVHGEAELSCPLLSSREGNVAQQHLSQASLTSHHSMFSSSLVAKAFASLAMALLLQLSRQANEGVASLADQLHQERSCGEETTFQKRLASILTETERISPPIIGVMRRVIQESGIHFTTHAPTEDVQRTPTDIHVPRGWDVWPYFPLANRDTSVYGPNAHQFHADRYLQQEPDSSQSPPAVPEPLSFGAGVKNCAGHGIVRLWLEALADRLFFPARRDNEATKKRFRLNFDEEQLSDGVHDWLGWTTAGGAEATSWHSIKQLPTQRPRKAIYVTLTRSS